MSFNRLLIFLTYSTMALGKFDNITLNNFKWINEPNLWSVKDNVVKLTTEKNTDFWRETYYNFTRNSGHVFGVELDQDFTFTACIEADFNTLYDQAGLMVYVDESHWLKAGIEYNDGEPMIGSVSTDGVSDWGTGVYPGNPRKFYLRLSKAKHVVVVKYSTDNTKWRLLRLAPFAFDKCSVGVMACSPQREGLEVKFTGISITEPVEDILHSN